MNQDEIVFNYERYEEFVEQFEAESARKDRLLEEVEKLELKELRSKKDEFKGRKYDRMFRGLAIVKKIYPTEIFLSKENGTKLGRMVINPEIAKHMRVNDQLELTIGLRGEYWRIVFLACIGSCMSDFV